PRRAADGLPRCLRGAHPSRSGASGGLGLQPHGRDPHAHHRAVRSEGTGRGVAVCLGGRPQARAGGPRGDGPGALLRRALRRTAARSRRHRAARVRLLWRRGAAEYGRSRGELDGRQPRGPPWQASLHAGGVRPEGGRGPPALRRLHAALRPGAGSRSRRVKLIRLPNGQQAWGVSHMETAVLYHQIYELETYGRAGLRLAAGDTVVDVGANVGLVGMWLAQRQAGLRLYAFEPAPALFDLLRRNAAEHMPGIDAHLFDYALADAEGECVFEFDPTLTFASTRRRDVVAGAIDRTAPAGDWVRAAIADMAMVRRGMWPRGCQALLERPAAKRLALPLLTGWFVLNELRRRAARKTIRCRQRRLSDVLAEEGIGRVDLLKVDVEGSELDVLRGIEEDDWPKIRQLAVEVHDAGGQLAEIERMLREHGFQVEVRSEE